MLRAEQMTFSNFDRTLTTEDVFRACKDFADAPEQQLFTVVCCSSVAGFHLKHAVANALVSKKVVCLSSDSLTNHMVEVLRNDTYRAWQTRLAEKPLLILEDVQSLAGKVSTTEEVYRLIKRRIELANPTLVFSTVSVQNDPYQSEDLKSILSLGRIADAFSEKPATEAAPLTKAPSDSTGYTFISYSSKNQSAADAMRDLLKRHGIKTWMAPGDIPAGRKYAQVINQAVKNCACFLLILSKDAQDSVWVPKEIERAVNYRKPLLPVQIEDVILNDEFEFYISSDQIVALRKIDSDSAEIRKILNSVTVYTEAEQTALVSENEDIRQKCFYTMFPIKTFSDCVDAVLRAGECTVTGVMRAMQVGYMDAARLVDEMEEQQIVGPYTPDAPRKVLLSKKDWKASVIRQTTEADPATGKADPETAPVVEQIEKILEKADPFPVEESEDAPVAEPPQAGSGAALDPVLTATIDPAPKDTPEELPEGRLAHGFAEAITVSKESCHHPIEVVMPDRTVKVFDVCREFHFNAQREYVVACQECPDKSYLFFVFKKENGRYIFISEGKYFQKVYLLFIGAHKNDYHFTDDKTFAKSNSRSADKNGAAKSGNQGAEKETQTTRRFTQKAALQFYPTADDIPQILRLPDQFERIMPNVFEKLNLQGKEIRQIIIPDTVETIESDAFAGLTVTEAVYIPHSVSYVGYNAFSLKDGAYYYCEGMSSAYLHDWDHKVFKDIPFHRASGERLKDIAAELSHAKGITHIEYDTIPFYVRGKEINEIVIPDGICVIDSFALSHAKIMKRIVIPSSVTSIGHYAFDLAPDAYVECDKDSYSYLFCKENNIRNSVDIADERAKTYRANGVCAHCGGTFGGLLKKKCSLCGREKDY